MKKSEKKFMFLVVLLTAVFGISSSANAMHIMEGYLPLKYCISWSVLCIPFLIFGFIKIKGLINTNRKSMVIISIVGAFIFVISSLKIPSATGSCSHMTGTGLGAILIGPCAVSILGIIVLIFQAILLAHGGLTTLGANTFSMAIAGPILSMGIYKLCDKMNLNRKISVFFAAALGDLFTYCVTSIQLALAYPSENGGFIVSAVKFLGVFAPTQLPLAIIEGILTVVIVIGLETYANSELLEIGFLKEA